MRRSLALLAVLGALLQPAICAAAPVAFHTSTTGTSSATFTILSTSSCAAGKVALMYVLPGDVAINGFSDTNNGAWSATDATASTDLGNNRIRSFSRVLTASINAGDTLTLTLSAASVPYMLGLCVDGVTGLGTKGLLTAASSTTQGAANNITGLTGLPNTLVGVIHLNNSAGLVPPSGWIDTGITGASSGGFGMRAYYKTASATPETFQTSTTSASVYGIMWNGLPQNPAPAASGFANGSMMGCCQ